MVEVTQEDRDAAAEYLAAFGGANMELTIEMIRRGSNDGHPLVQAFARHRAAAEARGRVAERADAVRWLRAQADDWGATAPFADAADAFERGEHLTPEPTQ